MVNFRFEEAAQLRQLTDTYKHLLVERDPMTLELVARFALAERYSLLIKGRGESCEVTVPIAEDSWPEQPRALLRENVDLGRYFTLGRSIGDLSLGLKVTDYKVDDYGDVLPPSEGTT